MQHLALLDLAMGILHQLSDVSSREIVEDLAIAIVDVHPGWPARSTRPEVKRPMHPLARMK